MIQRALLRQGAKKSASSVLCARPAFLRSPIISPFLRASYAQAPITSQRLSAQQRWYSAASESSNNKEAEAPKKEEAPSAEAKPTEEAAKKSPAEETPNKELEEKKKEIIDLKDKYLRSVAEYRNLQERTKREVDAARNFAIQKFAKDLVDTVDNLDRAIGTVDATDPKALAERNKELHDLYQGLQMTERIMMQTLAKHGLERFDPSEKQEKFNPNMHEATFHAPQEGKEDGTVFFTQQKGFILNGRVLRAAKVGVVKNA
ncbi:MAG: Mitochondrial matrix cochaperone [Cirrosporium novae-zelandiae]|nr:MAG: Mitochondrial matrix cochaperone [Cirrosporium novae-zelandiae]